MTPKKKPNAYRFSRVLLTHSPAHVLLSTLRGLISQAPTGKPICIRSTNNRKSVAIKKTFGFTLVELVIAISIAGIVFTGVLSAAAYLVSRSSDPLLIQQSIHVGEAYIAEIIARDFEVPSVACTNEAALLEREEYSKICHYDGLNNTSVENQVGEAITELATYSVVVDIAESADLGPAGDKIANTDAVIISVTVTSPDGNTMTLSVYRTNAYG